MNDSQSLNYLHKNHHRCLRKMQIPGANSRPIWFPGAQELAILTVPPRGFYALKFENHFHRQPSYSLWGTPRTTRIFPETLNQCPKAGIKITLPSFIVGKEPCVTAATHTAGFTEKRVKHKRMHQLQSKTKHCPFVFWFSNRKIPSFPNFTLAH